LISCSFSKPLMSNWIDEAEYMGAFKELLMLSPRKTMLYTTNPPTKKHHYRERQKNGLFSEIFKIADFFLEHFFTCKKSVLLQRKIFHLCRFLLRCCL
jgi:hypothetical protein